MANPDGRCLPAIEVDAGEIRDLFVSVANGTGEGGIERLDGGLTNTLYRWTPARGGPAFCLRIFAAGQGAFETERAVLARIAASLPVPQVLKSGHTGGHPAHPYAIYRWIDGVTLNECRRQTSPDGLRSLAEPLGMLLARVAAVPFDAGYERDSNADRGSLDGLLAATAEYLQRGRARARLGGARADALWRQFAAGAPRLAALRLTTTLVHGDCSGRNILVRPHQDGTWSISGLIDWETAFPGWGLWDVGSLFRYRTRYDTAFRCSSSVATAPPVARCRAIGGERRGFWMRRAMSRR